MNFRYFSCVEGKAVARCGYPNVYIGAKRTEDGMVFQPEKVVAIPENEVFKYMREYRRHLDANQRGGAALISRTEEDFKAWSKPTQVSEESEQTEVSEPEQVPVKKVRTRKQARKRRASEAEKSASSDE